MSTVQGDEGVADFTSLDGIGPKTADALHLAGITTMRQLATTTVSELVVRLDAIGTTIIPSRIISQRWLFQAWERSHGDSGKVDFATPSEIDEEDDGPAADMNHIDDTEPVQVVDPSDWVEHASFIICFDRRLGDDGEAWQTRVWDTKAMVEEEIPGTSPGAWIDFILSHARLPT